jgi:hypothetical protein
MILRLAAPLFVLLLAALPAAPGHAQAGGSVDLFKDLDSIRLSTAVGGPLDPQGGTEPQLFAGDLKRFNRFQQGLEDALNMKLATCGLFVSPEAADELSVEVFGRLEKLQHCTPRYVYMIQAKVRNSKLKGRLVSLRPVIGIADEAGLEKTLIDAAVAAVAAELRSCHKPKPAPKPGGR